MAMLAGMIAAIKKRGSGWLSETERELLDREDASGAIHLHNKEREVAKPEPAPVPVYAPSGFLDGCEPEPEKVPDLLRHHKAEIEKLEALLRASKGETSAAQPGQFQSRMPPK
jgi:hypothetical protein